MTRNALSPDKAYIHWRAKFAPFESRCFEVLYEFVRVHFDTLFDRYYLEGHDSLKDFPAWAFERYLYAGHGSASPCRSVHRPSRRRR